MRYTNPQFILTSNTPVNYDRTSTLFNGVSLTTTQRNSLDVPDTKITFPLSSEPHHCEKGILVVLLAFLMHVPVALLVASRYALPGYSDRRVWVRAGWCLQSKAVWNIEARRAESERGSNYKRRRSIYRTAEANYRQTRTKHRAACLRQQSYLSCFSFRLMKHTNSYRQNA